MKMSFQISKYKIEKGKSSEIRSVGFAQNFRQPLLAVIVVGKAHVTMYTDEANSRLKTGEAIFVEISAVIPSQAGIQM